MTRIHVALTLLVIVSCSGRGVLVLRVAPSSTAVIVRATNITQRPIVIVSPNWPNRVEDSTGCALELSSRIIESIQPYAFTPQLITLQPGEDRTFSIELPSRSIWARCVEWNVTVEYSYLFSDEMRPYLDRPDSMRTYLLRHQRLATARSASPRGRAVP